MASKIILGALITNLLFLAPVTANVEPSVIIPPTGCPPGFVLVPPVCETAPYIGINSPANVSYSVLDDLLIDYTVVDEGFVTVTSSATLDDQPVANQELIDLSVLGLGFHTFRVRAEDSLARQAVKEVVFETFTPPGTGSISESLDNYLELGLIDLRTYFRLKLKLQRLEFLIQQLRVETDSSLIPSRDANQRITAKAQLMLDDFILTVILAKGRTIDSVAADILIAQAEELGEDWLF